MMLGNMSLKPSKRAWKWENMDSGFTGYIRRHYSLRLLLILIDDSMIGRILLIQITKSFESWIASKNELVLLTCIKKMKGGQ